MEESNYYEILNIASTASFEEIRAAYKRQCKIFHPDVNKSIDATRQMQLVNEAYRVQSYDTVAIAEGYHPLVGAPGYQMYYLWTMAGAQGRGLISSMDPAHAWVKK